MTTDIAFETDRAARAVERNAGALVRVEGRAMRASSGVIFGEGFVVTAAHAVSREPGALVEVATHDGATHPAHVVGRDDGTDFALLEVRTLAQTPAPAWSTLADANARVGTFVLALARPGKTVRATFGIVSTLGEGFRTPHGARVDQYLETDAALRRGFSGGALVDLEGRVLGMTTAGLVRGASMTLPTETVRRLVGELRAHGRVRRGYLGVGVYPARLSHAQAQALGQPAGLAFVTVEPGSAAERGGIVVGDVLLSVDGAPVTHPAELSSLLGDKTDAALALRVLRGGVVHELTVTPEAHA